MSCANSLSVAYLVAIKIPTSDIIILQIFGAQFS